MGGLKDLRTTIPGLAIIAIVGAALLLGKIDFNQFVTFIGGLLGGGLITANTKVNPGP